MSAVSIDKIRLCVAPMMGYTDRFCRTFHRLLAPSTRLYTEMVHAHALIYGSKERVAFRSMENPVALQLGGCEPAVLARAAQIAAKIGYSEVNLNCGCPSGRVQSGGFGACLMREPHRVVACVQAMVAAIQQPITVKCRLGVDNTFCYEDFASFVEDVAEAGAAMVIVHARQALLDGVSPKDNRQIPPLCYEWVYRFKREHPRLPLVLNGGVTSLDQTRVHLSKVDGVMVGRSAYHTPYLLHQIDAALFKNPLKTRVELLRAWRDYAEADLASGVSIKQIVRPVLGLFHGQPGGKRFRSVLSNTSSNDWQLIERAMEAACL